MIAVAIDGPSGAGKSTLSRAAAKKLGFIYVDTGALYRAIGLFAVENGIGTKDAQALAARFSDIKLELAYIDGVQRVLLSGRDVSDDIRTPEISMAASDVSAIPQVRAFLLDLQRDMAKFNNVVMDGRDIGTIVLPDAEVKIFLTASEEERARRRYNEYIAKGGQLSYNDVLADMKKRDYNDQTRETAPLKPAPDAKILDTTGISFDESLSLIIRMIEESGNL